MVDNNQNNGRSERYTRNGRVISSDDQALLKQSSVCVVGCGGLGGHAIELLARAGIGSITVVDGDQFEISNLNRQLLSLETNIGQNKAVCAGKRINEIDHSLQVNIYDRFLNEENASEILSGHTVVIDALDNIPTRLILEDICNKLQIPLIHGAIAGWYGQITTILPGNKTLSKMYKSNLKHGEERNLGNPSFAPSLIASFQVAETIKLITKKGDLLSNKLLFVNCLENEFDILNLK